MAGIYEELAKHLDAHPVGFPTTETSLKILEVLYPGQEAEVAVSMSFEPKTAAQWAQVIPEKADLEALLDRMARRGTVFTQQKPGEERIYRLLPTIVGISETPFFAGVENETTRALSPLWVKFFEEGFGEELERGKPLVRVVPITESLEDASEILPYDAIAEKLAEASFIAVARCPCRQMRAQTGGGCSHTLENCLHIGSMGRYMVEQGMGRKVETDEVLQILADATSEGLVHVCDNINGVLATICNCCPCCCAFLTTMKMGHQSLSRSNYVAAVNAADCVGCGSCEDRCPVGAVAVGEDEVAVVDPDVCIGCGVCTPWCGTETMALVLRDELVPPPDVVEFVQARLSK
jgi:electron transport complex protein RnfB